MKTIFVIASFCLLLTHPILAGAGSNSTQVQRIQFARSATSKTVTGYLTKTHSERFYKINMRVRQKLSIKVSGTTHNGIVPLIFVTSPSGVSTTEKIYRYDTYSTESGDYVVRVAPNLMASNGTSGWFSLKVWAK